MIFGIKFVVPISFFLVVFSNVSMGAGGLPGIIHKPSDVAVALNYLKSASATPTLSGVKQGDGPRDLRLVSLAGFRLQALSYQKLSGDRFPYLANISMMDAQGETNSIQFYLSSKAMAELMDQIN